MHFLLCRYPWQYQKSTYDNTQAKLAAERMEESKQAAVQEQPIFTPKPSVSMRRSRVMRYENEPKTNRQVVKKSYLKTGDVEYDSNVSNTIFQYHVQKYLNLSLDKLVTSLENSKTCDVVILYLTVFQLF